VLQTQESALQIDVQDPVPLLFRHLGDAGELALDTGVVHCIVQPAEGLDVIHHPLDVRHVRDVRHDVARFDPVLFYLGGQRREFVFSPCGNHDLRAALGK
jgi:hypothetical protein